MASPQVVSTVIRAARPTFRSRVDRVAFAVHAYYLAEGYKLVGVGDSAENTEGAADRAEVGVEGWNSREGEYAFLYADEQGKRSPVLVKCLSVGPQKLLVQALAVAGGSQPVVAELDVDSFTTGAEGVMEGFRDVDGLVQRLSSALGGGGGGAARAAGSEPAEAQRAERRGAQQAEPPSSLRDERYQPLPGHAPPLGYNDLYPPGARPGMLDPARGPGLIPGGGMHMGPGDPAFSGGMRFRPPPGGHGGPGVPGGARWDPIAPPGLPGWNPDDFQRGRQPPTHPDVQPPGPGRGTDFDAMFG